MAARDLIGQTIGNYTIVRRLGSGGMGEVYEAQQPTIGARVAIKVLNADATDPASAKRFLIEAQAVNRIQHDGVVKILDAGYTSDDRPYLVMEFLDGASLAEVMKAPRRVPMGSACRIVADVLGVLAEAHGEGIVHRDLKPHNIFLTRSGRTVVLDFGVAKLLDTGSVSLTLTGAILGTPAYMAPEQIQGEAVDGRADLYALGVVLYELVTGRRPFDGDQTFDILTAHVERRPPPPRALRPEIPDAVQSVLMAALAKEPGDRFDSAEAMRAALLQAAVGLPPAEFAAIDLPGVAVKRTPTVPPTSTGPLAEAAAELANPTNPTVPMPGRDPGSGPVRKADLIGADVTIRAKPGALDPARARTASTPPPVEDPMADTIPETSLQMSGQALSPPPGASTMVPGARRPLVGVAIVAGLGAIAGAFAIGRFIGSRDKPSPAPSALVSGAGSGSAAGSAAVPPDAAGIADDVPITLPREVEQRLLRRHLHLRDLRPEIVDFLRTASRTTTEAAAQLPRMIPQLVAEIDRVEIDATLIAEKLARVRALARAAVVPGRVADAASIEIDRAELSIDKSEPVRANEQLWRAEWWLEHGTAPP